MKSGRITTFSFGTPILQEHRSADGVNVLDRLDVLEVSVTPSPANRNAQLVSVKTEPEPAPAPKPQTEIARINAQLDELAGPTIKRAEPGQVDAFLLEEKQRYVEEALTRADQATWDRGGCASTLSLGPCPCGSTRG